MLPTSLVASVLDGSPEDEPDRGEEDDEGKDRGDREDGVAHPPAVPGRACFQPRRSRAGFVTDRTGRSAAHDDAAVSIRCWACRCWARSQYLMSFLDQPTNIVSRRLSLCSIPNQRAGNHHLTALPTAIRLHQQSASQPQVELCGLCRRCNSVRPMVNRRRSSQNLPGRVRSEWLGRGRRRRQAYGAPPAGNENPLPPRKQVVPTRRANRANLPCSRYNCSAGRGSCSPSAAVGVASLTDPFAGSPLLVASTVRLEAHKAFRASRGGWQPC